MIVLRTSNPIAEDSLDHQHPLGTLGNNTCPAMIKRILSVRHVDAYLDLGCAGGGLVKEMLDAGVPAAIGLEGSVHAPESGRGVWGEIPDHLFTCDITKPFELIDQETDQVQKFMVVTAFEVFEHIPEYDIKYVFENINKHTELVDDALCIFTISNDSSWSDGIDLHITKRDNVWWVDIFGQLGWRPSPVSGEFLEPDDWGGWVGPSTMHFVLEKIHDKV